MLELFFRMEKKAGCNLYSARAILPRISLAAVLLALLTGCGAGDSGGEWRGTREVIGAVDVVRNPGTPLLKADEVAVELLWATPDESGAAPPDNAVWAEPAVIRRSDNQVFVLDRMEHRVYALNADDGRWLRTIGRQGGGPGELELAYGIAIWDGELVVGDAGKVSLEVFAEGGAYLRSVPVGVISFSIDLLDSGRFLMDTFVGTRGELRLYRLDGSHELLALWPPSAALDGAEAECIREGAAGAYIIRFDCAVPHIQLIDEKGTLLREILVDRPSALISDAEREAEVDNLRTEMARVGGIPPAMIQRQVRLAREKSRIRPVFRRLRRDPASGILALWEQDPESLGGGPATLHLFSDSGIYLAALPFERAWVDFDLVDSTLLALERDPETDLARAVGYRIELPDRVGGLE